MKKYLSLIFLPMLFMIGCDSVHLSGQLDVFEPLQLISKKTFSKSKVRVNPGKYRSVSADVGSHGMVLSINGTKVHLKGNRVNFPAGSGAFKIPGAKIGQQYDIAGNVIYSSQRVGGRNTEVESCSVLEDEYTCSDSSCRNGCCYVKKERPGLRTSEYYDVNYHRKVNFQMLKGSKVVAKFNGQGSGSFKDYVYVSDCEAGGRWP